MDKLYDILFDKAYILAPKVYRWFLSKSYIILLCTFSFVGLFHMRQKVYAIIGFGISEAQTTPAAASLSASSHAEDVLDDKMAEGSTAYKKGVMQVMQEQAEHQEELTGISEDLQKNKKNIGDFLNKDLASYYRLVSLVDRIVCLQEKIRGLIGLAGMHGCLFSFQNASRSYHSQKLNDLVFIMSNAKSLGIMMNDSEKIKTVKDLNKTLQKVYNDKRNFYNQLNLLARGKIRELKRKEDVAKLAEFYRSK